MSVYTEDEAKTMWCPFARVPFGNGAVNGNRGFEGHSSQKESLCIGSACMAWRWKHSGGDHNAIGEPTSLVLPHGYCGLAGKP